MLLSDFDKRHDMPATKKEVPKGTLELMILTILVKGPMHGYAVMQRLQQLTGGVFQVTAGSLFPALQRLEESGCVSGEWGVSENNRRARFYTITKAGRKQLDREERHWKAITMAVGKVLQNA